MIMIISIINSCVSARKIRLKYQSQHDPALVRKQH